MRASLTLVILAALAAAQGAPAAQDAAAASGPGLSVVGFDWKYSGYKRPERVMGNESIPNRDSSTSIKVARSKVYVFQYAAKVALRNEGTKAVKAVWWEHVFTEEKGGKELKRYRLQSKQQIRPGETQTVSANVELEPGESSRHISTGRQSVELVRVEYADGSAWKKE